MNVSTLITEGNVQSRKAKAQEVASEISSSFDRFFLDADQTPGIDKIRNLKHKISYRPFKGERQALIIYEAQNLTLEAQNALLKMLEEPPSSVKIVLTAPTIQSVLSTISSRCQIMHVAGAATETAGFSYVEEILQANPYERYQELDRLDLDKWLSGWRDLLLSYCFKKPREELFTDKLRSIISYVRLIIKLKSFQKRRASPKLLKMVLLLQTPNLN
ncbi:MAG: hypothetical protein Q8O75_03695 [bacterium]|nr:hypothetical protein [bacterium]